MSGNQNIKKIIVYTLLYVYLFAQVKPLLPVVKDYLAHTIFKTEHLATVHLENGKYHLHVEMKKVAGEHESSKNNSAYFCEDESLAVHEQINEMNLIVLGNDNLEIIPFKSPNPKVIFLETILLPPEA